MRPVLYFDVGSPFAYLAAERAGTSSGARTGCATSSSVRRGFADGRDLSVQDEVLGAAEAAGLDRAGTERAIGDPVIKLALRQATEAAYGRGVFGVPTVAVGPDLFWGDDRLGAAAAAMR